MLEEQIKNEVKRLSTAALQDAPEKKKKVPGLVYEPLGKRVLGSLFEGDFKTVFNSIVREVMIPKTKDLMADIFIGGINKAIYGDESSARSYSGYSSAPSRRSSYDAYYQNGKYYTPEPSSVKPKVKWDKIVMRSRPAATTLIDSLRADIKRFGKVSIADLYDYVIEDDEELGTMIDTSFPDSNWGWKNLDRVSIESVNGGFWIRFPKPVQID